MDQILDYRIEEVLENTWDRIFFLIYKLWKVVDNLSIIGFDGQSQGDQGVDFEILGDFVLLNMLILLADELDHVNNGFMENVRRKVKFGCQKYDFLKHFVIIFSLIFSNDIWILWNLKRIAMDLYYWILNGFRLFNKYFSQFH